jgi:hypothetical protein
MENKCTDWLRNPDQQTFENLGKVRDTKLEKNLLFW